MHNVIAFSAINQFPLYTGNVGNDYSDSSSLIVYNLETATLSWDQDIFSPNSEEQFFLTIIDSSTRTVHVRTTTSHTNYNFTKPHTCGLYIVTLSVPGANGEAISVSREIGYQGRINVLRTISTSNKWSWEMKVCFFPLSVLAVKCTYVLTLYTLVSLFYAIKCPRMPWMLMYKLCYALFILLSSF